jgi:aryl-alcohol dehydrogenase-like predicted oxidoreductase
LRELPASERSLVFTKCCLLWDENGPMAELRRVLRPESNRAECEACLPRLGVERLTCTGICYSPLQLGLLTDGFSAARLAAMASDDWKRRSHEFQEPRLGRILKLRDALGPIAPSDTAPPSAVTIAWVLACPGVSGGIVGARRPVQIDGWIQAARLAPTAVDLDEIARPSPRAAQARVPPGHPCGLLRKIVPMEQEHMACSAAHLRPDERQVGERSL